VRGDIGYGPRVVGRVLGLVAGGEARCYPKRANNFGTSNLVGKTQDANARDYYEMAIGEEGWRHHPCS
jgi:hypothetical protein